MTVLDDHMAEILLSPAEVLAAVSDIDRRSALLALAVRRLETSGDYATGGAVSINAWLREHARMTNQRAGELVSTGRFLDTYPAFAQAAVAGTLSGSQIDIARRLCQMPRVLCLPAQDGAGRSAVGLRCQNRSRQRRGKKARQSQKIDFIRVDSAP